MGLLLGYRGQGWGSRLLRTAIDWAREQDGVIWIDLGVFHDNPGARRLYEKHGFTLQGEVEDQFRVDGVSLNNAHLSLWVGAVTQ